MKINLKKSVSCIASVAAMFSLIPSAFAVNDGPMLAAVVNYTTNTLDVTYNSPLGFDSYITVYVADSSSAQKFSDFSSAVGIGQEICPAEGNVEINIKFDNELDGSYDVFAVPGGANAEAGFGKVSNLRILGKDAREGILNDINGASETAIGSEIYSKLREVLFIEEPSCPSWKSLYLYAIKNEDCGGKYSDFIQIDNALRVSEAINFIRETDSVSLVSEQIDNVSAFGLDKENKDYNTYKEIFVKRFASVCKSDDVRSASAVKKVFDETASIVAFNERDIAGVASALSEYEAVVDISSLKNKIKSIGAEVIARQIENKEFTSVDEIKEAVTEAVNRLYGKKPQSSGGGGGGGGGSSPSKAGSAVSFPNANPAQVQTKPSETKPVANGKFSDVQDGHWAKASVEALADKGVINGYSDGSFRPGEAVRREEFVQMIVKAFAIDGES